MGESSLAQFQEAFQQAHERSPQMYPWGYFAYGDAPGGIGGGVGAFAWFKSREGTATFLTDPDLARIWYDEEAPEQMRETLNSIHKLLIPVVSGECASDEVLPEINRLLRGVIQIEWWGRFAELVEGESDFARKVRSQFRFNSEDDESYGPGPDHTISDSEIPEFVDFLSQYGL